MVPSEIIERGILFFVTEGVIGPDSKLTLVITEKASIPKSVELILTGVLDKDFYNENCDKSLVAINCTRNTLT